MKRTYKVIIEDEDGNDNTLAIQELLGDIPSKTIEAYEVKTELTEIEKECIVLELICNRVVDWEKIPILLSIVGKLESPFGFQSIITDEVRKDD